MNKLKLSKLLSAVDIFCKRAQLPPSQPPSDQSQQTVPQTNQKSVSTDLDLPAAGKVTSEIKTKLIGLAVVLDTIINVRGPLASRYFDDRIMGQYADPWPFPANMGLHDSFTRVLKDVNHYLKSWIGKSDPVPFEEWVAMHNAWDSYHYPIRMETRQWIDSMMRSIYNDLGFH